MRFVFFFAVVLLLLGSMALFVARRTRSVFQLSVRSGRILLGVMLSGILLMFLKRFAGDSIVERFLGVAGGSLTLTTIITFVLMMVSYWLERGVAFTARLAGVTAAPTPNMVAPASDDTVPESITQKSTSSSEQSETTQRPEHEPKTAPIEGAVAAKTSPEDDALQAEPAAEHVAAAHVEDVRKDDALAAESGVQTGSSKPLVITPEQRLNEHAIFGRRGFLAKAGTGAALAVGASTSMYAGIFGRHDYVIEEVPIKLAQLPPSLDGFTIVQLSDIHVGTFVRDKELRSALALVDKAKPDLIVLTGDLLDHDEDYGPALGELTRKLGERAPVVAVVGNHDYYAGFYSTLRAIRGGGGEMLVNQGKLIGEGKLALLGVDDVWAKNRYPGHGPDIHSALATVPQDLPRILLCHNPVYFPTASPHVDLQLSGHTHGGQINLGVRPASLVLPYVEGHYRRDQSQLWVNRGFGTAGPPARLQAAPEVTKVILTV